MSMTENEATREMTFDEEYEILQKEKDELFAMEENDCEPLFANCVVRRALRCIRKLLEEIQQYRAIGTVEELKTMKENGAFSGVELAQLAAMQMRLRDYQAIGTIEEFKALKEKSEPKNWIAEEVCDFDVIWQCPACKEYQVLMDGTPKDNEYNFCPKCGQALVEMKGGAE